MLEDATSALLRQATDLCFAVEAAAITVHEDRPEGRDDHKLVQDLMDDITELSGIAAEARAGAELAASAIDLAGVPVGLAQAHRCALAASRRLRVRLLGGGRTAELRRVARTWSPAWQAWTEVMVTGLERANAALDEVDEQVLRTWRCVTEGSTYRGRQAS